MNMGRDFSYPPVHELLQSDQDADTLLDLLVQVRGDLCWALAEVDRLRLPAESAEPRAGIVLRPEGSPEYGVEDSAGRSAGEDDVLLGHEVSSREDDAVVRGLVALRDERDRLLGELLNSRSELKAARDSVSRLQELEQALDSSRQECETLRAELERRDREKIAASDLAEDIVPDRAAIEQSEVVEKQVGRLVQDGQQTTEEPRSELHLRLDALTLQLAEARSDNERLRALLKVFGMVRHLGP